MLLLLNILSYINIKSKPQVKNYKKASKKGFFLIYYIKRRNEMKKLPNMISIARALLSIALIFPPMFSWGFYTIYIICGLSDLLDGVLARKLNCVSVKGAMIDSAADIIFFCVLVVRLVLALNYPLWVLISIAVIALIRTFTIIMGAIKFKKLTVLHTVLNKIAGSLVFLSPLLYLVAAKNIEVTAVILIAIVLISSVEEFAIVMLQKTFDPDVKFLFPRK